MLLKKTKLPAATLRPLLAMAMCAFAIGMAEFVIMGILPDIAADLNESIPTTGLLITGYSLGVALTAPFVILLTGELSRRNLLLVLMLLFVAGNVLAVVTSGFAMLMTARIIASLTHGSFFGAAAVVASGMVPERKRAWAISMIVSGSSIANIVGGVPFGTFLGHWLGWRSTFGAITIIGTLAFFSLLAFLPKSTSERSASASRELAMLGKPQVLIALVVSALCFGGVFMTFTYIAPILEQITSFGAESVSWVLVLFGVGVTLGNYIGGRLADWKLNFSLIVLTLGLCGSLLALTWASHNKAAVVIDVFLLGIFSFGILPCLTVNIMNKAMGAPSLATTMNVSALHIANAAGAWLGGVVIDSKYGLQFVPLFASLITILGIVVTLLGLSLSQAKRKEQLNHHM